MGTSLHKVVDGLCQSYRYSAPRSSFKEEHHASHTPSLFVQAAVEAHNHQQPKTVWNSNGQRPTAKHWQHGQLSASLGLEISELRDSSGCIRPRKFVLFHTRTFPTHKLKQTDTHAVRMHMHMRTYRHTHTLGSVVCTHGWMPTRDITTLAAQAHCNVMSCESCTWSQHAKTDVQSYRTCMF